MTNTFKSCRRLWTHETAVKRIRQLELALRAIEDMTDGEIQARFGNHPSKTAEELGRNSTIYSLLVVPRNIARAALEAKP